MSIANAGPRSATGVTVAETLQPGVNLVAASSPGCMQSGQKVTCTIGTVAKGGLASVTITVSGTAGTSGTFTVNSSGDYDPNPANTVVTVNAGQSGITDGPLPPWALVLTGLSFLWITARHIKNYGSTAS